MAPRVHRGAIASGMIRQLELHSHTRVERVFGAAAGALTGGRYYANPGAAAVVVIFRTGPVEQADWANLIAGCSGYFDRISLASK
jgi:hypothetical protein